MLMMKTRCELCRSTLAAAGQAWICSYECTYCPACRQELESCPNCGGELVVRPRRTTGLGVIARRTPGRVRRRLGRSVRR